MPKLGLAALFIGLSLAVGLVAWQGFGDVAKALNHAGFQLLWLGPAFALPLVLSAFAWAAIFPHGTRPALSRLVLASWIAVSINWLLPVAQIGGEIAKAAWLARRAAPAATMVAATVVDKVLQTAGQALVALVGVGLALALAGASDLVPFALVFALLMLGLLIGFVYAQRHGLLQRFAGAAERAFLKRALASRDNQDHPDGPDASAGGLAGRIAGHTADVGAAVTQICAVPGPMAAYLLLRLASRLVMAGEVWLVLMLLGHPVTVLEALMIECLAQTLRSAAFALPGAYGVQEGGFILLGTLVGVPPDLALTASLAKRLRELLVGLPGLAFYQLSEGRRRAPA
ncbi:flippase-like domain-containing protein [Pelagibius sp.]|uniref:flippase-like domain-containing protein n=1 Tax=Pelagibius sp. TaxID=1931238 RepID=UPI002606B5DB|nr:flippase-like domain-containing protein [Pelagibius sp.]